MLHEKRKRSSASSSYHTESCRSSGPASALMLRCAHQPRPLAASRAWAHSLASICRASAPSCPVRSAKFGGSVASSSASVFALRSWARDPGFRKSSCSDPLSPKITGASSHERKSCSGRCRFSNHAAQRSLQNETTRWPHSEAQRRSTHRGQRSHELQRWLRRWPCETAWRCSRCSISCGRNGSLSYRFSTTLSHRWRLILSVT
mmetsp:Transcript_23538/g.63076  ORF Transcript_23538/g.63076 Transcript_23538/m.63076 type:complete len:204 (+) Transcript_23538:243-854(+)